MRKYSTANWLLVFVHTTWWTMVLPVTSSTSPLLFMYTTSMSSACNTYSYAGMVYEMIHAVHYISSSFPLHDTTCTKWYPIYPLERRSDRSNLRCELKVKFSKWSWRWLTNMVIIRSTDPDGVPFGVSSYHMVWIPSCGSTWSIHPPSLPFPLPA